MYSGEHTRAFTVQAAQSLAYAQQEAQRFNHNYIGTEHLLLGLLHVTEGHAAEALRLAGVKLDEACYAVAQLAGHGGRYVPWQIGLTPRAKEVIERAIVEMKAAGEQMIDTDHLLLALLQDEGGLARDVLRQLKVDPLVLGNLLLQTLHPPPRISGNLFPAPSEHENEQHDNTPTGKEGTA
ncbi:MAG TPA: Clp protease N-terminal domain-containing protein [Ktedonobacterales bacterium]